MTSHPVAARIIKTRNLMGLGFSYTEIKRMSAKEIETWQFVFACEVRRRKISEMEQNAKAMAMR